ncbi:MAG: hypothetical protein KAU07_00325 [Candidatus Andersenbacteria bacterium]|nr:hypothetical protein [Candidatus Andersenbacteria bacterium]
MIFEKNINISRRGGLAVLGLKLFFCIVLLFTVSLAIISNAKANELGESKVFLVDFSYDFSERSEITATLKKIGASAYFYVEDDYYNNLSRNSKSEFDSHLNSLVLDFDNTVYPKTREAFGYEWNPGIDNDGKITILFVKTKENIGGYFNPSDEYRKDEVAGERSNEREMIYLNIAFIGDNRIKSFLAHEFQHMITWYHKTKLRNITDDIWLNEARSEYASTAIGYDDDYLGSNLRARVKNFKIDPVDSLTEWQNKIYDYSSVNLFSQYLADRFGKEIFKRMIDNNKVGIQSINKALSDLYYKNDTFQSVFKDWVITNYVNGTALDGKYSYQNENLNYENFHIQPKNVYELNSDVTINIEDSIKDWSNEYYELDIAEENCANANKIKINFDGQDTGQFSVSYVISYESGTKKIGELNLDDKQDSDFYVSCLDENISSVTIIPISHKKTAGFGNNINKYSFSISAKITKSNKYKNDSLLKSLEDSKVYLIENGNKRWITSAAVFISNGYKWEDIVIVTELELELYPSGENIKASFNLKPDGSLIKGLSSEVYLIENNNKRWITSATVFISNGYKWEDIIIVTDHELNLYLNGKNITSSDFNFDKKLLKGSGPEVYLIENGNKRWITSAAVFISNGYKWEDIMIVTDYELSLYLEGDNIVCN